MSHNNSAFVLVHQKQFDEAEKLINFAMQKNGGSPHELSLLAICKSNKGENEKAKKIIKGAEFYGGRKHTHAIINFSKSIICFNCKDIQGGKEYLKKAIELKEKEIKKYIGFSGIIKDLRASNPQIENIFKEYEK